MCGRERAEERASPAPARVWLQHSPERWERGTARAGEGERKIGPGTYPQPLSSETKAGAEKNKLLLTPSHQGEVFQERQERCPKHALCRGVLLVGGG